MKGIILLVAFVLQGVSSQAADTLRVTTSPVMICSNCENKIKKNIRFVKGTKRIITDIPTQTVTVIYDGKKTSRKDFEEAFRKIGYEIKSKETVKAKKP